MKGRLRRKRTPTCYGYGKIESRYENRIELDYNNLDEYGVPQIKVHFSLSQTDWNVVHQMAEGIRRIAANAGIRSGCSGTKTSFVLDSIRKFAS